MPIVSAWRARQLPMSQPKNGVDCLVLRAISDNCDEAYDAICEREFDLFEYARVASAHHARYRPPHCRCAIARLFVRTYDQGVSMADSINYQLPSSLPAMARFRRFPSPPARGELCRPLQRGQVVDYEQAIWPQEPSQGFQYAGQDEQHQLL
mgnify:CR=1 FL=1